MYLLDVNPNTGVGVAYAWDKPANLIELSNERMQTLLDIDDLQNAEAIDGNIKVKKQMGYTNFFILCYDTDNYCIAYRKDKLREDEQPDGIRIETDVVAKEQLFKLDSTNYEIVNAYYKDGVYIGLDMPIPRVTRLIHSKDVSLLSDFESIHSAFLQRMYDVYCEYSITGHSPRKPAPYEQLDKSDWHWLRQILKTFYSAEYNDWVRLLTAALGN